MAAIGLPKHRPPTVRGPEALLHRVLDHTLVTNSTREVVSRLALALLLNHRTRRPECRQAPQPRARRTRLRTLTPATTRRTRRPTISPAVVSRLASLAPQPPSGVRTAACPPQLRRALAVVEVAADGRPLALAVGVEQERGVVLPGDPAEEVRRLVGRERAAGGAAHRDRRGADAVGQDVDGGDAVAGRGDRGDPLACRTERADRRGGRARSGPSSRRGTGPGCTTRPGRRRCRRCSRPGRLMRVGVVGAVERPTRRSGSATSRRRPRARRRRRAPTPSPGTSG